MKKIISLLIVAVLLTVCVTGCKKTQKNDSSSADNSLEKVLKQKQFVLGLDDSFPPYGYRDDTNQIVGYDIDLATEVCKRLGVSLVCQPIDWNAKDQELNTGKIDCIWNGLTITPEREEAILFSKPYVDNSQVVAVKKDSTIRTLEDLAGKKLGLQAGSSAADALEKVPEFKNSLKEIIEFKENLTALMDLEIGGVDGVLLDIGVAQQCIDHEKLYCIILEESVSSEKYGIGFRKNDKALCEAVENQLLEMVKDGTMKEIDFKWFKGDKSVIGK